MTMPVESARALLWARKLLKDVALCKEVPEHLRNDARQILGRYPLAYQVEHGAHVAPNLLDVDKTDRVIMQALEEAGNEDRIFERLVDKRFEEITAPIRQVFADLSEAEFDSMIIEALANARITVTRVRE